MCISRCIDLDIEIINRYRYAYCMHIAFSIHPSLLAFIHTHTCTLCHRQSDSPKRHSKSYLCHVATKNSPTFSPGLVVWLATTMIATEENCDVRLGQLLSGSVALLGCCDDLHHVVGHRSIDRVPGLGFFGTIDMGLSGSLWWFYDGL